MNFEPLARTGVPIQDVKQVVEQLRMQRMLPIMQHEEKACRPTLQKGYLCIVELTAKVQRHRRGWHRGQVLLRDLIIRPKTTLQSELFLKQLSILGNTCNVTYSCSPMHPGNHLEADAICLHIAHLYWHDVTCHVLLTKRLRSCHQKYALQ